jgi:NAD(P)-dependent dehydrogenase (short-subunit alcohol dehydrogenase family)
VFAALSARVGSIGDNHLGGWYAYRASKTALNMLIHTLAIEHRRTRPLGVCVALHPGTVDTALSAPFQSNVPAGKLFTADQSAAALMTVMDGLGPDANGSFFAWDGSMIAW